MRKKSKQNKQTLEELNLFVIQTRVEVWKNEKCCGNTIYWV